MSEHTELTDRAREVLAKAAFEGLAQAYGADVVWLGHGCEPEAIEDCYGIADFGLAALADAEIGLVDLRRLDLWIDGYGTIRELLESTKWHGDAHPPTDDDPAQEATK